MSDEVTMAVFCAFVRFTLWRMKTRCTTSCREICQSRRQVHNCLSILQRQQRYVVCSNFM